MFGRIFLAVLGLFILLFGISAISAVDWNVFVTGEREAVTQEVQEGSGLLFLIGPLLALFGLSLLIGVWFVGNSDEDGEPAASEEFLVTAADDQDLDSPAAREARLEKARLALEGTTLKGKIVLRNEYARQPERYQDLIDLADELINQETDS